MYKIYRSCLLETELRKKSNISSFLSSVHSFLDGKEIVLVPWHQIALILDT